MNFVLYDVYVFVAFSTSELHLQSSDESSAIICPWKLCDAICDYFIDSHYNSLYNNLTNFKCYWQPNFPLPPVIRSICTLDHMMEDLPFYHSNLQHWSFIIGFPSNILWITILNQIKPTFSEISKAWAIQQVSKMMGMNRASACMVLTHLNPWPYIEYPGITGITESHRYCQPRVYITVGTRWWDNVVEQKRARC